MQKKIIKKSAIISIFLALFLFFISNNLFAKAGKDLILVLDTSLSMAGHGGDNILPQVKESLYSFIDELEEDDSFTFVTFDTEVRIGNNIKVEHESNKKVIKDLIAMQEAKGKWTYTQNMAKKVRAYAEELEKDASDSERKIIIVILTDTIDDPPPGKRKDKGDIKKFAEVFEGKQWFVFKVDFSKDPDKFKEFTAEKKDSNVKVIAGKGSAKEAMESVKTEIAELGKDKNDKQSSSSLMPFIIVILIVIALLLLLWYLHKLSKIKVRGFLAYHDNNMFTKEEEVVDLAKYNAKKVIVGKGFDSTLRLRDYESGKPIILKAYSFNGVVQVVVDQDEGIKIDYSVKNKKESFLKDGDVFVASNFTFTYTHNKI